MAAPRPPGGSSVIGGTVPSSVNGVEGHARPLGVYAVAAGDCLLATLGLWPVAPPTR